MKATLPIRAYVYWLTFLFYCFSSITSVAQCPAVRAVITNGPLLNLCTGSTYTMVAETKPEFSFYQWQKQTTTSGAFNDIAGANTSSYAADATGAYRVIVGNGTCTDTSTISSITTLLLSTGNISGGPTTPICVDSYVGSLWGAVAPGDEMGAIRYHWQIKEYEGVFVDIPGANGTEYNVGYVKTNTSYRRAVSDFCGNSVYSNALGFTTYGLVKPGTLQPALQTIPAGTAPFAITSLVPASGSGNLAYRWQSSLSVNGPWETVNGATSETYTPGNLDITTYFSRTTVNDVCGYNAVAEPVLVVVTDPVILNAGVLYSDNACLFLGSTPYPIGTKVKPVGGTIPYLIEWELKTATGAWTLIAGEHNDKLYPGPIAESTSYRKKVTDAKGTVAYTEPALLSVISLPLEPGGIAATATVACIGSSPGKIISIKSGANFGERGKYEWQVKTVSGEWTIIPNESKGDYQPQPITENSVYRRVFYDFCGPNGRMAISNEVAIDAKPALFAGEITPATQMVIAGRMPKQLNSIEAPHGGTNAFTIWWEQADLAIGPWTKITGATGFSYQPPVAGKTAYYRRVVKDNNCLAEKFSFIIEVYVPVYPALVGGKLVGPTCVFPGNTPAAITTGLTPVSGGMPPYSFQWESRSGTGAFNPIAGATSLQYQPAALTQTTQYRRVFTDALGSQQYSDTVTVQLISTALVAGKIAVSNSSICAGASPGIIKSIEDGLGLGGAHYQWQQRTETGTYTDIAGATANEYTPAVLLQSMYFRRTYTDECSGVNRTGYSNEVFIKATPASKIQAGLIKAPAVACEGIIPGTILSELNAGGSCNLTYQWQVASGTEWTTIAGATSEAYTSPGISVSTKYRRKVTDGTGISTYSNEVEIIVYPRLTAGAVGADSQLICTNALPAQIAPTTTWHYADPTISYQWQSATSFAGPFTDVAGATTVTYQPAAANSTYYYRLKVKSANCGATAYTNVVVVVVKPGCNSIITSTADGFTNCNRVTPVTISYPVQACNATQSFEWQYQVGTSSTWTGTGIASNNLVVNAYYQLTDELVKWRLKMTSIDCQNVSFSNVLGISQSNCRQNSPVIYPNPAPSGGDITINTPDKPTKVNLMTIDGKRLNFKIISNLRGLIKLQLPSLPSGTYIILLSNTDGEWAEKLLISNK